MAKQPAHPTSAIWDTIGKIAADGSMHGQLSVKPDGETGLMSFTTADGQRFVCDVYRPEDAAEERPRVG
jgi:hypothetical protein